MSVLYFAGATAVNLDKPSQLRPPHGRVNRDITMNKQVVITGMGCVSPLGNDVSATWEAIIAGKSGAAPNTAFDASAHDTRIAAEVKGFDASALFGRKRRAAWTATPSSPWPPPRRPWPTPALPSPRPTAS